MEAKLLILLDLFGSQLLFILFSVREESVYIYQGCYIDTEDRDISPDNQFNNGMTIEMCIDDCAGSGRWIVGIIVR